MFMVSIGSVSWLPAYHERQKCSILAIRQRSPIADSVDSPRIGTVFAPSRSVGNPLKGDGGEAQPPATPALDFL
jgi:hypothetical protein